ncbi:MAG: hypothetical protein ACUVXD_01075, partial [Thermodesulfobacteriota bacterium]
RGQYRLVPRPPKQKPVMEYLKRQGRFRHLSDQTIAEIQRRIDEDFRRLEAKARLTQETTSGESQE